MPSGELEFLKWLEASAVRTSGIHRSIGDDAAILAGGPDDWVVATDTLAEGTHFQVGEDPERIGRKALAVNLSDLAAMGASPRAALLALTLPHGFSPELPRRIVQGIRALGAQFHCPLVGGDTTTHRGGIVATVTVLGCVEPGRGVLRSGARAGDCIFVTGALGGSLQGRHLDFVPRLAEAALISTWGPSAMMDVSDGLLLDLARLAEASGVGFELDLERVPVHPDAAHSQTTAAGLPEMPWHELPLPRLAALRDGEDFELLFAMNREAATGLLRHWSLPTPLTGIGEFQTHGNVVRWKGTRWPALPLGYVHE
jgi:thiamine-monophosphate kinase